MKFYFISLLITMFCLSLTSCYQDLEETSLNDYIYHINENNCGYSSSGIDNPDYFLPSDTFISDFDYIEGGFHWKEYDPLRTLFTSKGTPEISLLYLKYSEVIYCTAKSFMLESIKSYNNLFYEYDSYIFYENSNFYELKEVYKFPESFTMACYNDKNYTLLFIGLSSSTLAGPSCLEKKYLNNIRENWKSFIDQYYGEYYNFNN